MSEDLTPEGAKISVTRYWGGEHGICYQVTESEHDNKHTGGWLPYVKGTRKEMVAMALAILNDAVEGL